MAMQQSEKFLFETSFDPEDAQHPAPRAEQQAAEAAPPEAPTYSEEDLAAARTEAQAAGREQGLQEAVQSQEHQATEALTSIARHLDALLQSETTRHQERARATLDVGLTIIRKLFPKLAFAQALPEIDGLIADCLTRLHDEPRVVIRVADSLLDPLRQRIGPLTERSGFEGKVVLIAEEQMEPGAVRVEWADGGAERDVNQAWRSIEKLIEKHTGPRAVSSDPAGPQDVPATAQTAAPAEGPATPDAAVETDAATAADQPPQHNQPAARSRDTGPSEDQRSTSEVAGGLPQRASGAG